MVPGGWASRKAAGLGREGRARIREFVHRGGLYIGFCGGAGLALQSDAPEQGLGLTTWGRKPMQSRLPNCSGHVGINPVSDSPFAPDKGSDLQAPVWWPSQFQARNGGDPWVLAAYSSPGEDFWVADIPVNGLGKEDLPLLEGSYGINLDPGLLKHDPAMIQGSFGRGEYLLSYLHLETPDSPGANRWLSRIVRTALSLPQKDPGEKTVVPEWEIARAACSWENPDLVRARQALEEVVAVGEEHFLLCWRKPWLLGWRRGIPGFALNTLLAMLSRVKEREPNNPALDLWAQRRREFTANLQAFARDYTECLRRWHRLQALGSSRKAPDWEADFQRRKDRLVGPFPGQQGVYAELVSVLQDLIAAQAGRAD